MTQPPRVTIEFAGSDAPAASDIVAILAQAGVESQLLGPTAVDAVVESLEQCRSGGVSLAQLIDGRHQDLRLRIDGPAADSTIYAFGEPDDDERIYEALALAIDLF